MNTITVDPVRTPAELREFVDLPFRLYGSDRNWVPPLRSDLRKVLDRDGNPFFEHGVAGYFLARRAGRAVGRISAHVDRNFNEFHTNGDASDRTGFWGFFECEEDPDATAALFDAAAGFLAGHGMATMVGPASFTLNDECGLLVDGFDSPPVLLMTYNPPFYELLVEKAGFEKAQDLYAYRLDADAEPPADVVEFARTAEDGFTFRRIDLKDFEAELGRALRIYNEAWERNWGFCPMTEREIRAKAKELKPILDPNLVIVAEQDGEPVGFGLTVPDVNEVLVRSRGRLGPVTIARMLWRARRRRWNVCRVFVLGVRKEFRRTGVGAHLYVDTLLAARRGGYRWGEMSWILESNDAMNRAIRHMGGTVYKTYRMYERAIG
jgi:GNAT superfamily N-acetyltransferase